MEHLVIREGNVFQISDRFGDFSSANETSGLYLRDTRHLSRLELAVNGERPEPLSVNASANVLQRTVSRACGTVTSMSNRATLTVERQRVLYADAMYERIRLTNHGMQPAELTVEVAFAADFVDVFELRGLTRTGRGRTHEPIVGAERVVLGYRGLDEVNRETELVFTPQPSTLSGEQAQWTVIIAPRTSVDLDVLVRPATEGVFPQAVSFDDALAGTRKIYEDWRQQGTVIESDSDHLNHLWERSILDLRMLAADHGHGPFLVAGVPWFAVPFGRDSLIGALQTLALRPELARGTLRTMASLQGATEDAWRVEEPGKIPHELRFGEMANLDEIPFRRYYGSVDSTPLFLVLVSEYYAWTGDLELMRELLPNIQAALRWIDTYGDQDQDGFVEYQADAKGLGVQSWKDSNDSMSHRDGTWASSPVAVSEVQGYVYQGKRGLAPIFDRLGDSATASRLSKEAEALKKRFNEAFWMEDRNCLAIALDGTKVQVGTVSSDAGHCLWSGIVDGEKAPLLARRLIAPDMFSGWGIRTLSTEETSYNPMSYHNGSVWPHDNSLIVLGLKRYGFDQEANRVMTGILDAARHFSGGRLPELFCGFTREEGAPVEYPVACSPQAWAAAATVIMVQAMLGLEPDAAAGVLRVRPLLPDWIGRMTVRGLRVGGAVVDLMVQGSEVAASVREGILDVRVEPVGCA